MNLKEYKILDGVEQRSRHAAEKILQKDGLSLREVQERIPELKGRMLKFAEGIARWNYIGEIDLNDPSDCADVNVLLLALKNQPLQFLSRKFELLDALGRVEKQLTIDQVLQRVDATSDNYIKFKPRYKIFKPKSYEEALRLPQIKDLCFMDDEATFDAYTGNGKYTLIVAVSSDYSTAKTDYSYYPYDKYGLSLVVVFMYGDQVISSTTRYNDVAEFDHAFSENDLKQLGIL